ncbi:MAG: mechanosensitive ion channel family protein [Deltaproteobacteria bacterium]|nr:mechanosensitive ion channel family protein [Deltaproteobacteria bacterium]
MDAVLDAIGAFFTEERLLDLVRVVVLLVVGFILARTIPRIVARVVAVRATPNQAQLVQRMLTYTIVVIVVMSALTQLGVDVGVLVGAAGLLTVALGFAAQASTSNLISGVFLMGERAFDIGDTINVAGYTGEVLSIDLMSVKLRTGDNLYVRIPNELLLKSPFSNLSRFPIRRIDVALAISDPADFDRARDILTGFADQHPLCLAEPRPSVAFTGYDKGKLDLQFSVWVASANLGEVKPILLDAVLDRFRADGIALPLQSGPQG